MAWTLVNPPLAAMQAVITREGVYKKRPTLTGIARILRNRGLAGLVRARV